jgi:hypothetical protein
MLAKRKLPTQDDLQQLNQQLDTLAAKLDQISQNAE